eukprot:TRINITY_DN1720_c0_g1_i3.p1 TRINITY_DN1720_c0_g1~~TRINITY_DN1720_c0_g1_i3.p1  ORF type:complete len:438 (-),score=5.69 TRINITY_DN1720_c0_g1_i3:678-1991(-)
MSPYETEYLNPLPIFPEESFSCDSNSCIYCQPLCEGPFQNRDLSVFYSTSQNSQISFLNNSDSDAWYLSKSWKFHNDYFQQPDPVAGELTQLVNFKSCKSPRRLGRRCPGQNRVSKLEFSDCGRFLAGSCESSVINLYGTEALLYGNVNEVAYDPIAKHSMPIRVSTFAWSPHNEGLMFVGDVQGAVSHIHIYSGHFLTEEQQLHNKRVTSLAYSPWNNSIIASSSADGRLILWDGVDLQSHTYVTPANRCSINDISFSNEAENIISLACSNGCIYTYDIRNLQQPLDVIQCSQNPVISVKHMSNNKMLTQQKDGQIQVWDMNARIADNQSRQPIKIMTGLAENCSNLSSRCCDNLLARGDINGQIQIYNLAWTDPVTTKGVLCDGWLYVNRQQQYENQNGVASISWLEGSDLPNLLAVGMEQGQVLVLTLTNPDLQ